MNRSKRQKPRTGVTGLLGFLVETQRRRGKAVIYRIEQNENMVKSAFFQCIALTPLSPRSGYTACADPSARSKNPGGGQRFAGLVEDLARIVVVGERPAEQAT
jgi:hypothetical protein